MRHTSPCVTAPRILLGTTRLKPRLLARMRSPPHTHTNPPASGKACRTFLPHANAVQPPAGLTHLINTGSLLLPVVSAHAHVCARPPRSLRMLGGHTRIDVTVYALLPDAALVADPAVCTTCMTGRWGWENARRRPCPLPGRQAGSLCKLPRVLQHGLQGVAANCQPKGGKKRTVQRAPERAPGRCFAPVAVCTLVAQSTLGQLIRRS